MFQFLGAIESLTSNPLIFMVVVIALMFGLTYFTSVKPQKKREKLHQEMIAQLSKGDKIMTIGGFIAKVNSVKDSSIVIELCPDNVKAEIDKSAVRMKMEE